MVPGELTPTEKNSFFRFLDEAAIREVIANYFYGLDRRDFEMLKDCFTEDAKGEYDGGNAVYEGRGAILNGLRPISQFGSTSHVTSSMAVKIDGDHAKADTYAIAFLVVNDTNRVLIRGLQYLDQLIRLPEGWRIRNRVHVPAWQYEVDSVPPARLQAK